MQAHKTNGRGYIAGSWPLDPARPTLVFIHGAGGSSVFWQVQVEALCQRVNTVALDLPGHGRSDKDGKTNVADYATAVADFISAMNVPGPIPCGLSMGGAITQQLLWQYPQRFKGGILISTGARLRVAAVIFETIKKDYDAFIDMIADFAISPKSDPARVQPFIRDTARCPAEVIYGDFLACDRFDARQRLAAIEAPVLVVSAGDDRLTPPKFSDFLTEKIRNAERVHIPNAGHIVPLEKPAAVNQSIAEFLQRRGLDKMHAGGH